MSVRLSWILLLLLKKKFINCWDFITRKTGANKQEDSVNEAMVIKNATFKVGVRLCRLVVVIMLMLSETDAAILQSKFRDFADKLEKNVGQNFPATNKIVSIVGMIDGKLMNMRKASLGTASAAEISNRSDETDHKASNCEDVLNDFYLQSIHLDFVLKEYAEVNQNDFYGVRELLDKCELEVTVLRKKVKQSWTLIFESKEIGECENRDGAAY